MPLEDHPSLCTMSPEPILVERFRIETQLHHMHITLLSEQLFDLVRYSLVILYPLDHITSYCFILGPIVLYGYKMLAHR